jgi:hypothetical protein
MFGLFKKKHNLKTISENRKVHHRLDGSVVLSDALYNDFFTKGKAREHFYEFNHKDNIESVTIGEENNYLQYANAVHSGKPPIKVYITEIDGKVVSRPSLVDFRLFISTGIHTLEITAIDDKGYLRGNIEVNLEKEAGLYSIYAEGTSEAYTIYFVNPAMKIYLKQDIRA